MEVFFFFKKGNYRQCFLENFTRIFSPAISVRYVSGIFSHIMLDTLGIFAHIRAYFGRFRDIQNPGTVRHFHVY